MTEKRYDNGRFAKWYYCQTNTICDGTNRYYLGSKEPTPDFDKEVLLGTNQLLDLLNEQFDKIESLETHCIVQQNHIKRLENENIQLYNKLKIFAKIGVVCDKYNIQLEDLPETLEEYIALDNGEEL